MGKSIETGIFTSDWGLRKRRVGKDAFVALLASDERGTKPIVVVRSRPEGSIQLPDDFQGRLGCWTKLSEGSYGFAERLPVIVYGGDGPFNLTPRAYIDSRYKNQYKERVDIDEALRRMMNRAARFARAIMEAA